uniref:HDC05575 n=1 Tax=Drosophila melanogaster TaxID=7227 RepID=Q6IGR6_DROME|nr:TPA_inf: HDC05575 [Drosophila melanogaster]
MAIARNSTPLIVPQVKSTDFSAVYSRNPEKLLPAVSRLAQCQNISNVRYQARSKLVAVGSRFAIDSSARERAGSRARRPPISEKLKASSDTYLLPRCVVFPGVTKLHNARAKTTTSRVWFVWHLTDPRRYFSSDWFWSEEVNGDDGAVGQTEQEKLKAIKYL